MESTVDTLPFVIAEGEPRCQALRALARCTYPGLEPPAHKPTGHFRAFEVSDVSALDDLQLRGWCMRRPGPGRFWCITHKGRRLAVQFFGTQAMAQLIDAEGGRKTLVEGKVQP
jgi:hypothetical protein